MTLDLTINEINIILQALGNAPYVSVAEVIEKIRTQAQALVQPEIGRASCRERV